MPEEQRRESEAERTVVLSAVTGRPSGTTPADRPGGPSARSSDITPDEEFRNHTVAQITPGQPEVGHRHPPVVDPADQPTVAHEPVSEQPVPDRPQSEPTIRHRLDADDPDPTTRASAEQPTVAWPTPADHASLAARVDQPTERTAIVRPFVDQPTLTSPTPAPSAAAPSTGAAEPAAERTTVVQPVVPRGEATEVVAEQDGPVEGSGERTVVLAPVATAAATTVAAAAAEPETRSAGTATALLDPPAEPAAERDADRTEPPPGGETRADRRRQARRAGIVAGAVGGALVLLYGLDLALSQGSVPRGVTVAGVEVGGMEPAAAEQKLREQIGPRLGKPVQVRAGDVQASLDPKSSGLELDWARTIADAGEQSLNPWTRLTSFFSTREVGVASRTDQTKLTAALEALRPKTDREAAEGTIRFEGVKPVAVDPKPGQKLDVPQAVNELLPHWADGTTLSLPVTTVPVKTTPDGVRKALDEIAKPAVSGPVTVQGEGKNGTLEPAVIASALTFQPGDNGGLTPKLDENKITEAVRPQLKDTEQPGKDAKISLASGAPVVEPSQEGRGIDYAKTFAPLPDVLRRAQDRTVKAEYGKQPAKFTTEQANQLGVKEVIAEFKTGGFAADSGHNIRLAAEKMNGAVVKPGETFSMNRQTGPRTAATGYIGAGIINDGKPDRAVGGGVSQMATTLYNAAYYAGMTDAGHTPHSYWINRYPKGREATVFQNPDGSSVIDLQFRNDTKTGVLIETIWTPSSITVRFWGTKTYQIEGLTGAETNQTDPPVKHSKPGEQCVAAAGTHGFTVTDTRVIKDLGGREIKRESRSVRYDGQPKIVCTPQDDHKPNG
ncbi:VanW family protein [Streptoalloteichus hindustanus]|uniref:Vancomycin resistance protein YoaR, contains peptidoglycan-binding and VanW domains n=1 Tax=Streptoalloteichus hindustanus TaxID=2017 RepID=A0A1M4UM03_STRHI|nr:VanW family protein [Streptoalloteichus hindustanus]SHE57688.1 Vancomycin resistance protein YoaR, contains peptidoglycan-binding and VanW domains [Streptoalloteichus hindustanus]